MFIDMSDTFSTVLVLLEADWFGHESFVEQCSVSCEHLLSIVSGVGARVLTLAKFLDIRTKPVQGLFPNWA